MKRTQKEELEKKPQFQTYASNKSFRSYLLFWLGQNISLLGSSIVRFAIIWWITVETESAIILSIASVITFLPQVITVPIAGVFADKWNRRLALIIIDFSQALFTFILVLVFLGGWGTVLVVLAFNFIRSIFQAFHMPTVDAIVPAMVPKDRLTRMNSINNLFTGLIRFFGPIIGAVFLVFWSITEILWIDIITFIIAVIPLLFISIPSVERDYDKQEEFSFTQEFKEGLLLLKNTPGFLVLALWSLIVNFLSVPFMTLLPYFVKVTHSGTELNYAILLACLQAGSIIGALIISIKKNWSRKPLIIMGSGVLTFIGYLLVALTPPGFFLMICIGIVIRGFTFATGTPIYYTILQTAVPPDKQGRISSIDTTISFAIIPVGMAIAGPLANFMGIVNYFIILSISGILVNVVFYFFTGIRKIKY
ncbi:MAG: MFS transporter [Candidatus Thorarchaeota archaeon]